MASRVEFHPQCVTNAPTPGCDSTCTCGAHGTIFPNSLVRSTNPSGRCLTPCGLRDQRKGALLASNASAKPTISSGGGVMPDPKLRIIGPMLNTFSFDRRSSVTVGSSFWKEFRTRAFAPVSRNRASSGGPKRNPRNAASFRRQVAAEPQKRIRQETPKFGPHFRLRFRYGRLVITRHRHDELLVGHQRLAGDRPVPHVVRLDFPGGRVPPFEQIGV
nr:3-glucosyl transferase [Ipomoea batatas]